MKLKNEEPIFLFGKGLTCLPELQGMVIATLDLLTVS
jgi:hypothetical protein